MKTTAIEDGVIIEYASGRRVEIHFGGLGIHVFANGGVGVNTTEIARGEVHIEYDHTEAFETKHSGVWINADPSELEACDEGEV